MHACFRNLMIGLGIVSVGLFLVGCNRDDKTAAAKPDKPVANANEPKTEPRVKAGEYELSGPFTHENLSIFLIHGEDKLKDRKFVLLGEALEKKLIVIDETQEVNTLKMENVSATEEVLILSGDILKGGQQDRIAQYDQFVPAKSGKLPLVVFCVEHTAARWMKPLTDEDKKFHASPGYINSNELRLSNRQKGNQAEVWHNVAKSQKALSMNAGVDVKAKESDSSLALSQDAKEVKAAADKYIDKLKPIAEGKADVIGYAFAINGKVYTADVYGSPNLFLKVWPRLINASAIEAFAEKKKDAAFTPASTDMVKAFLDEADKGKADEKEVRKDVRQVSNTGRGSVRFETFDAKKKDSIRRNYLAY